MYRRLATGVVDRGQTEAFLKAMAASRSYQAERGIRARTTVWGAITGPTNGVVIASDFERLDELEDYLDLATQDAAFAQLRRDLRATMVADASRVSVLRLSFHSDGLITSEDATAPRRYMRTLAGDVRYVKFSPRLPATRSGCPSRLKSPWARLYHHPRVAGKPMAAVTFWRRVPALR